MEDDGPLRGHDEELVDSPSIVNFFAHELFGPLVRARERLNLIAHKTEDASVAAAIRAAADDFELARQVINLGLLVAGNDEIDEYSRADARWLDSQASAVGFFNAAFPSSIDPRTPLDISRTSAETLVWLLSQVAVAHPGEPRGAQWHHGARCIELAIEIESPDAARDDLKWRWVIDALLRQGRLRRRMQLTAPGRVQRQTLIATFQIDLAGRPE